MAGVGDVPTMVRREHHMDLCTDPGEGEGVHICPVAFARDAEDLLDSGGDQASLYPERREFHAKDLRSERELAFAQNTVTPRRPFRRVLAKSHRLVKANGRANKRCHHHGLAQVLFVSLTGGVQVLGANLCSVIWRKMRDGNPTSSSRIRLASDAVRPTSGGTPTNVASNM